MPGFRKISPNLTRSLPAANLANQHGFSRLLHFETLENRRLLAGSDIEIRAAGTTATEQMELRIDGVAVANFNVDSGDPFNNIFQIFNYQHASTVGIDQIQVAFTNDGNTSGGEDRNLRVDGITLDGTVYESEHPTVFSTGTWTPTDGCAPGNKSSEWLHCGGHFQFNELPPPAGSSIVIDAAGETGSERMELQIDGVTVATFDSVGGDAGNRVFETFQYQHDSLVTVDQVRVALTNDTTQVDRNLRVDGITLDGVRYEAEAPATFSTGTWDPMNGCSPGNKQSEFLHCNGYFQFADAFDPGTLSLGTTQLTVHETDGTVSIPVVRSGGTDGAVGLVYATISGSAVEGADYTPQTGTVQFADGEVTQFIVVPLLDDNTQDGVKTFNVATDLATGGAALGFPRTATITILDDESPPPFGSGDGLLGEYYSGTEFDTLELMRVDSDIDFNWGTGSPDPSLPVDSFSVRWTGQIESRFSEQTIFSVQTDGGVRLWVDDQLIIDEWSEQTALHTGQMNLLALEQVSIALEFSEQSGNALQSLQWSSGSQPLEVVPQSQLYSAPPEHIDLGGTFASQSLFTGLTQPVAMDIASDGRLFIAEKAGIVRVAQNSQILSQPFIDISAMVNNSFDRGLLGIAVHPDFPTSPYVYLAFTYDPPEATGTGLDGPDGTGNRVARLIRVTADSNADFNQAIPGSEVVLLGTNSTWSNISHPELDSTNDLSIPSSCGPDGTLEDCLPSDSNSHSIGNIEFGGDGMLYVTMGDGTSVGLVDPRTDRVQSLDSLSGKLLRLDPLTGQGLDDNPFYNGDPTANRSKVVNWGLRNPFRFAFHPTTDEPYLGDVGWTTWEEINVGRGKNFGWPYYEGGNGQNLQTGGYEDLQSALDFYATNPEVEPPFWSKSHADGAVSVVLGDFYTGNVYSPVVQNALFFTDLFDPALEAIRLNPDGSLKDVLTLSNDLGTVVEMTYNPVDGHMYYVDVGGEVGRIAFTPDVAPSAEEIAAALGDFDLDGTTTGLDFLAWQIGSGMTDGAAITDGDSNNDGSVDFIDRIAWETNYSAVNSLAGASSSGLLSTAISAHTTNDPATPDLPLADIAAVYWSDIDLKSSESPQQSSQENVPNLYGRYLNLADELPQESDSPVDSLLEEDLSKDDYEDLDGALALLLEDDTFSTVL